MDTKPRTPLPPGMVPSASTENLSDRLEEEQRAHDQQANDIIKEGSLSGYEPSDVDGGVARSPKVAPGSPPEAWRSPTEDGDNAPDTFHVDLSGNEGEGSSDGTDKVPVYEGLSTPEMGKTQRRKLWSPFSRSKDKTIDLREEVLSREEGFSEQVTPKRLFSPLRKNKVAPSPLNPPGGGASANVTTHIISITQSQQSALQVESTSQSNAVSNKEPHPQLTLPRPQPTPPEPASDDHCATPHTPTSGCEQATPTSEDEPPLTPVILVRSKETPDLIISNPIQQPVSETKAVDVEALYNSVVRPKPRPQGRSQESDLITELPKLDTFEGTAVDALEGAATEPSLVVENHGVHQLSSDHTQLDERAYEMVDGAGDTDAPDVPVYSSSVYKELKKHQDTGNVHLVSMKGTVQDSQLGSFPEGSSTDLSPLHYVAARGDKKELSRLLSSLPLTQDPVERVLGTERMCGREGIDVVDSEGRTPLMHAVHNNHTHSVKTLAEMGANVNASANDGSTSLHQAAYSGSIDMVALLLSLGADGLKRDKEGRTPLHWCCNNTQPDTIDLILDKVPGLSVDVRDGAMMTPLMWAAFHGHQQHVMRLIERGADPVLTDIDGMTAAHWAVQRSDTRTLQLLISPESAGYRDNNGKTVMHQAAERGSAKAVGLIKAVKPTSVNDLDINGRTPLHWATVCENPEVIRALLAVGADPGVEDSSGLTALDYATQKSLHYCALLLSQTDGFDDPDSYQLVPTYGATTAGFGARALQQQEGVGLSSVEDVKGMLTPDQITQIKTVCEGAWLNKFSNEGRGPAHSRYFWVNPSNLKICWSKEKDGSAKDIKSDILVGVRSSSSPVVFGRKDFDPKGKHKYSFTIFTASRVLDVIALASDDYKLWLNGLQLLLNLGSVNATRVLSILQTASGDPHPIP